MTAHLIDAETAHAAREALLQVLFDLVENTQALGVSAALLHQTDRLAAAGRDIAIIAEALAVAVVSRDRGAPGEPL